MSNPEALRCAVRISDDIRPNFSASMLHIGNIMYTESKLDVVGDQEIDGKQHPRDIAFHEAERLTIMGTVLPGDVQTNVRKELMAPAKEMAEAALGKIGDFRFYAPEEDKRRDPNASAPFVYRAEKGRKNRIRRERNHLFWISLVFLHRLQKICFETSPRQ